VAYAAIGLGLSAGAVRETRDHARFEAERHGDDGRDGLTARQVFGLTTWREPALSAVTQAGLVNNLNDALAWGVFPLLFASHGLSTAAIGALAALYPAVWSVAQLVTGALSDHWGRKRLIVGGMLTQAAALASVAMWTGFPLWTVSTVALGLGTAMVYPTLLAAIGDVAHPRWRASSVGVYRLWRDAGFPIGALLAGIVADTVNIETAVLVVAAITALSGVVVAVRMYETHGRSPIGVEGLV